MDDPAHLYVLVRADIGHPHVAVQAAHAVLDAARAGVVPLAGPHPNFVICGVPGVVGLLSAAAHLGRSGVRFHVWSDSLFGGDPTALCTEPLRGDRRAALRRYPLLKG